MVPNTSISEKDITRKATCLRAEDSFEWTLPFDRTHNLTSSCFLWGIVIARLLVEDVLACAFLRVFTMHLYTIHPFDVIYAVSMLCGERHQILSLSHCATCSMLVVESLTWFPADWCRTRIKIPESAWVWPWLPRVSWVFAHFYL